MITSSEKYNVSSAQKGYKVTMKLTVNDLQSADIGDYACEAQNSIGSVSSSINVYCKYWQFFCSCFIYLDSLFVFFSYLATKFINFCLSIFVYLFFVYLIFVYLFFVVSMFIVSINNFFVHVLFFSLFRFFTCFSFMFSY